MPETEVETPAAPPANETVKEEAVKAEDAKEEKKDEEKSGEETKEAKEEAPKKKEKKAKEPAPPPPPPPHKKDFEKDVVYVYQFSRTPIVPSISPACLKLETWLKLSGIKFEVSTLEAAWSFQQFFVWRCRNRRPFGPFGRAILAGIAAVARQCRDDLRYRGCHCVGFLRLAMAVAFRALARSPTGCKRGR